jgi:hypothetical protein
MIGSFRQYLVEEEKVVYFSFGRMNPPTIGHGKLLDKLAASAGRNPYRMYVSQSVDPKKNPLEYRSKVKFIRKMFPKHARNVLLNNKVKNAMEVASALYDEGYRKIVMVVGSDRMREFDVLLNKYNGQKGRHGFYNFMDIKVISAGDRDPDAEGATGMSASKMRTAASDNDFTAFSQGLPKNFSNSDSKALFNAVRKGMGLKEQTEFKKHVQLEPVSEIRESYIDGKLFEEGDQVVILETGQVGKIKRLGSNYVIIEAEENMYRKWLDDVEKVDGYKIEYDTAEFSMPKPLQEEMKDSWGETEGANKWKKATPGQSESQHPNIWDNIRKRRAKGLPPRKPGEKGYPKTLDLPEAGPCWPGYKQVGTKMKNGKEVPNCVPESTVNEKIDVRQDPDIDELPGSQPATFQKGIKSKSTKAARHRHFQRMTKRRDDDPSAYKDAPGDKAARKKGTKPSQYTKKFKQMYGEQQDPVDVAKQRIDREKAADARRHDSMLDRARTKATKMKNRDTKPNV